MSNILVTDVNGTRANNVAQFARVESGNQFALTAESRNELLGETDHLSRFHVTGEHNFAEFFKSIPLLLNSLKNLTGISQFVGEQDRVLRM